PLEQPRREAWEFITMRGAVAGPCPTGTPRDTKPLTCAIQLERCCWSNKPRAEISAAMTILPSAMRPPDPPPLATTRPPLGGRNRKHLSDSTPVFWNALRETP